MKQGHQPQVSANRPPLPPVALQSSVRSGNPPTKPALPGASPQPSHSSRRAEFVALLQTSLLCVSGSKDETEWLDKSVALAKRLQARVDAEFSLKTGE